MFSGISTNRICWLQHEVSHVEKYSQASTADEYASCVLRYLYDSAIGLDNVVESISIGILIQFPPPIAGLPATQSALVTNTSRVPLIEYVLVGVGSSSVTVEYSMFILHLLILQYASEQVIPYAVSYDNIKPININRVFMVYLYIYKV